MSKTIAEELSKQGGALLFLTPEEIIVDEEILKARPNYDITQEQSEIEDLAKSIQEQGQIEPVVVRPPINGEDAGWHLVAGRRRRDAAMLINAGKTAKEEPYRLPAIVKPGLDAKDALRMAIAENLKRKNLNTVQVGLLAGNIRELNDWTGSRGTKKVADFMGVSPATITQAEKVLTLPKESQDKVANGEWSAQTAFEMLNVRPELHTVVEDAARAAQDAEEVITAVPGKKRARKANKAKKQPLKAKHVRAAARAHEAAIALKALTRNELLKFWQDVVKAKEAWNHDVIVFAKSYLMYAEGKLRIDTLLKHFGTIASWTSQSRPTRKRTSKPKK